jgi:hypothetical protein
MRAKNFIAFGFFISLFLFINSVMALPCAFFGNVTLDGSPTSGTYVEAYYLNETLISKGKEPSDGFGHYSIAVNAPGENITLKINGIPVDQGIQFCENGEPNYLDISATTPMTTTTTTSTTTTIYNGNGGGGGGGGSVTTTTVPTTTTITEIIEETAIQSEGTNTETTVPTPVESTTLPQTSGITGSFLSIFYSLGYWWILIIIIILVISVLILRKYYTIEFTDSQNKTPENTPEQ